MKEETTRILQHLDCNEETRRIRHVLLVLSTSNLDQIHEIIIQLQDTIHQATLKNHDNIGLYRFFVACLYYEVDNYSAAIKALHSAMHEMWGSPINKPLVCWLLGLCYSHTHDYPEARRNLEEALHNLATHAHRNSPHADSERRARQSVERDITDALERLFNEPLFRTVRPDPVHLATDFPLQNPPTNEEEGNPISISIPVTITNENRPFTSINLQPTSPPLHTQPHEQTQKDTPIEIENETRTDDKAGYMILPSQKIYKQEVRAGKSGELVLGIQIDKAAEVWQISLDGIVHRLYSLRSGKQINPVVYGDWGWMKVKGHSMNAIKKNVPIEDGDYVLVQKNHSPVDNDIVIAFWKHRITNDQYAIVKKFKQGEHKLISETNIKGLEYEPINMDEEDVQIYGIVYAVAKPIL